MRERIQRGEARAKGGDNKAKGKGAGEKGLARRKVFADVVLFIEELAGRLVGDVAVRALLYHPQTLWPTQRRHLGSGA
jgi:hypothetical protein